MTRFRPVAARRRLPRVWIVRLAGLMPCFRPYEIAFILDVPLHTIEAGMRRTDLWAARTALNRSPIKQPEAL